MKYRKLKNYKYQLLEELRFFAGCPIQCIVDMPFVAVELGGFVTIKKGYAWDGPSGPTIDTESFMRGSLVHDVLYQLIREGCISIEYRDHADRLLRRICIEDGMSRARAWYVYNSVKYFAKYAAVKR